MIDALRKIRDYLVADTDYTDVVTGGTFAARSVPPVGYEPADGPCVVLRVRGGAADYDDALLRPRMQFKCYGTTEITANEAYRALYTRLQDGGRDGSLLHGEITTLGQTLEEPGTEWVFVLAYGLVMLR